MKIRTKLGHVLDLDKLFELFADCESGIQNGLRESLEDALSVPLKKYGDEHNDDAYAIAYNVAIKDVHRAAGRIEEPKEPNAKE